MLHSVETLLCACMELGRYTLWVCDGEGLPTAMIDRSARDASIKLIKCQLLNSSKFFSTAYDVFCKVTHWLSWWVGGQPIFSRTQLNYC